MNLWKFHRKIFHQSASICCQLFGPPHGAMVMAYRFKRLPGDGDWGEKYLPYLGSWWWFRPAGGSLNGTPFWGWSNLVQIWVVGSTMFFNFSSPCCTPRTPLYTPIKLTQHRKMNPLKMYIFWKMVILRCDVSLPRGLSDFCDVLFGQELFKPSGVDNCVSWSQILFFTSHPEKNPSKNWLVVSNIF